MQLKQMLSTNLYEDIHGLEYVNMEIYSSDHASSIRDRETADATNEALAIIREQGVVEEQ